MVFSSCSPVFGSLAGVDGSAGVMSVVVDLRSCAATSWLVCACSALAGVLASCFTSGAHPELFSLILFAGAFDSCFTAVSGADCCSSCAGLFFDAFDGAPDVSSCSCGLFCLACLLCLSRLVFLPCLCLSSSSRPSSAVSFAVPVGPFWLVPLLALLLHAACLALAFAAVALGFVVGSHGAASGSGVEGFSGAKSILPDLNRLNFRAVTLVLVLPSLAMVSLLRMRSIGVCGAGLAIFFLAMARASSSLAGIVVA